MAVAFEGDANRRLRKAGSGYSPICMPTILKYFLTRIAAVLQGGGFESVLEILHASHGSGCGLFSLFAQPPLSRCRLMGYDVTACVGLEFICLSSKLRVVRPFFLARVQLLQLWFHRFFVSRTKERKSPALKKGLGSFFLR